MTDSSPSPSPSPSLALLADLGPKPLWADYIRQEGSTYVPDFEYAVVKSPSPALRMASNTLSARTADLIAKRVALRNNNEKDLTNHPWALLGVWSRHPQAGILIIMEWQPMMPKPTPVANRAAARS